MSENSPVSGVLDGKFAVQIVRIEGEEVLIVIGRGDHEELKTMHIDELQGVTALLNSELYTDIADSR